MNIWNNMANRFRCAFVLCAVLVLAGCGASTAPVAVADNDPPVIEFESDDPEMQRAVDEARETVAQFVEALENPTPSQSYLGIKARFSEGEVVEYMWLSDVTYDGDRFTGTVANNPRQLTNVRLMDRHEVPADEIADWMIVKDGRLVGGYSLRLLATRASPDEWAEMERHMGFTLD